MAANLADTLSTISSASFRVLDQVVVRADMNGDEGEIVREGSCGAVLSVFGDGAAYLVEFTGAHASENGYPIPILATIQPEKLILRINRRPN